jgi:hypothetical protein
MLVIDAAITAPTINWKKISGPSMRWIDRTSEDPSMIFSRPGTYQLYVAATNGEARGSARTTVIVTASDDPTPGPNPPPAGSPTVSVRSDVAAEGSKLVFKLVLSKPTTRDVIVDVRTRDVTAVEGADFGGRGGLVVIPRGSTTAYFGVPTYRDNLSEGAETMRLVIESASGASTGASGLGTING